MFESDYAPPQGSAAHKAQLNKKMHSLEENILGHLQARLRMGGLSRGGGGEGCGGGEAGSGDGWGSGDDGSLRLMMGAAKRMLGPFATTV
jgi:hypothetical protein